MADQLIQQAIAALNNGRFAEARAALEKYKAEHNFAAQQFLMLGLACNGMGDLDAGLKAFAESVQRHPNSDELWTQYGLVQNQMGDPRGAMQSLQRALKLNHANGIAAGNLASIYFHQQRYADAEDLARRATRSHPDRSWALNLLGLICAEQGKFEAAMEALNASLQVDPTRANTLFNMANAFVDQLDFNSAWKIFHHVRSTKDAAYLARGEAYARLLAGDYEIGWKLAEARLDMPDALKVVPPYPRWRGQDVRGKKVLLLAEQGLGDTIQFCRFGKTIAERGADISWAVQGPLWALLEKNLPGKVYPREGKLPDADFYIPLLSLPLATNRMQAASWHEKPYIKVPATGPELPPTTKKRKIGLVWAGSSGHSRDFRRSIPLRTLKPIWEKVDAEFYAPFIGEALEQIGDHPITRLDPFIRDFSDTAFLLSQLDCVITVDTVIGHLAAAMGVPVIMLVSYCPDWRWGLNSASTPWYDSLTLCRQPVTGDWASVVQAAIAALPVRIPNF